MIAAMDVDFDPVKRAMTLESRGLDMALAGKLFEGPTISVEDTRRDYGEPRFITMGFLDDRMVFVAWTPRDGKRRIISMRKANEREEKRYAARLR